MSNEQAENAPETALQPPQQAPAQQQPPAQQQQPG